MSGRRVHVFARQRRELGAGGLPVPVVYLRCGRVVRGFADRGEIRTNDGELVGQCVLEDEVLEADCAHCVRSVRDDSIRSAARSGKRAADATFHLDHLARVRARAKG